MNGRYKGYSRNTETALALVAILTVPVFIVMTHAPMIPALITIGLMLAAIIILAVMSFTVPCRFSSDEKGFTMKRLFLKRSYSFDEITEAKCSYYDATRSGRAIVSLVLTDGSGRTAEYCEISRYRLADMANSPEQYKTQLMMLCEYIQSAK